MGAHDLEPERGIEPGPRPSRGSTEASPALSVALGAPITNRALARALAGAHGAGAPGRGLTPEGALLARLHQRSSAALQRQPQTKPPPRPRDARHPENFHTYEGWLASFSALPTFDSHDEAPKGGAVSFTVLGGLAASKDPKATGPDRPPDPIGRDKTDAFIDHPTDAWVQANLPEELRQTAYRLPSDCADIAVILRHVWLFVHKRKETYGGFVVGYVEGESDLTRSNRVHQDMSGINTPNVPSMVNAYTDLAGKPLRSFDQLESLLHPGDILVWEHHAAPGKPPDPMRPRSGGHTQTIFSITRKDWKITKIVCLQGNQPLPSASGVGKAPGRRIEVRELDSLADLVIVATKTRKEQRLWNFGDGHTTLVVAGPPRSAERPAAGTEGGKTVRHLTDWVPLIGKAEEGNLQGRFEAAMREAQSLIERDLPEGEVLGEARTVAHATRERLADFVAKRAKAKQPADTTVSDGIHAALTEMEKADGSTWPAVVKRLFAAVRRALDGTVAQAGFSDAKPGSINYGERMVGHMRRIPLDGLPAGAEQAIVVVPSKIRTGPDAVDVLLHFHGHNSGYKQAGGMAEGRDISLDQIEQQLESSGRRMIAVLPQGTAKSEFDAFDTDAYLTAVFKKLVDIDVWIAAPKRGTVVMAGHSGGGKAATDLLGAGTAGPLGEVALFDGINGPGELSVVEDWVTKRLDAALARLKVAGVKGDQPKEDAILASLVRFRAYHSGSTKAKPSRTLLDYPGLHATLKQTIAKWFTDNSGELSPYAAGALAQRFQVISTGQTVHDKMVSGQSAPGAKTGALQDALGAL